MLRYRRNWSPRSCYGQGTPDRWNQRGSLRRQRQGPDLPEDQGGRRLPQEVQGGLIKSES